MSQQIIRKPAIAWVLLTTRKVSSIGQEPYVFTPGSSPGNAVERIAGWDDGSEGDRMEYESSEQDKLDFIKDFRELYPKGAIAFP